MGRRVHCEQHEHALRCYDCGGCLLCCEDKRSVSNDQLSAALKHLPQDFKPWGEVEFDNPDPKAVIADCSAGCRWFVELAGNRGADYGVCANPKSHRAGLLTFEHQGCRAFEYGGCEEEK